MPVISIAAAAPAFAGSMDRFSVTTFTSQVFGNVNSIKYELKITIKNEGTSAVSPTIMFTLDTSYGTIQGQGPTPVTVPATSGWTGTLSADKRSITYSNPSYTLAAGQSISLTFQPVNTSATVVSSQNIDVTVSATGFNSITVGDTRIP